MKKDKRVERMKKVGEVERRDGMREVEKVIEETK